MTLILASGSPYRRALLQRLQLPFTWEVPDVDERPQVAESPPEMARRLACAKAQAVADRHAGEACLVIGSDQVADLDGRPLGKPGNLAAAAAQIRDAAGRTLVLHTGLCVIAATGGRSASTVESFAVRFRQLDAAAIDRYLAVEQPVDAAGSFYAEGYGIVLFEGFDGRDPNALIGLPLMALVDLLATFGVHLP
ncbi:MAG: septum formation protein Maf [Gammaproteobacteria bacterium]|nr:MAG: septum formation protein Maf [Gammaproteobacteria bacterium]